MALDIIARAMAAHADGKAVTAYQYAVAGGYTGTEEQFTEDMGKLGINAEAVDNAVRFDIEQSKTALQKLQAQANIGLDTTDGDINAQLALRALINGYYELMGVGTADNLTTNLMEQNSYPFNFALTGGLGSVIETANRLFLRKIVYGSVVINQLAQEVNSTNWHNETGVTATFSDNEIVFTTPTSGYGVWSNFVSGSNAPIANRIFLVAFDGKCETAGSVSIKLGSTGAGRPIQLVSLSTSYERKYVFFSEPSIVATARIYIYGNADNLNKQFSLKNFICIDLPQWYGSAETADHIYAMETAHTGDGVNFFLGQCPQASGYIPYNTGTLASSKPSFHKTTGTINWFDITTNYLENKNASGQSANYLVTSHGLFRVLPNTLYRLDYADGTNIKPLLAKYIHWYDIDGNLISSANNYDTSTAITEATSPTNAYFAKLSWYATPSLAVSVIENAKPCLTVHYDNTMNGVYEPSVIHTYPFDTTASGHGIFKFKKVNNVLTDELYADGDEYASDGTFTKKKAIKTLASGDITTRNGYTNVQYFEVNVPSGGVSSANKFGWNTKFGEGIDVTTIGAFDTAQAIGKMLKNATNGSWWFGFAVGTTLEQAQAALAGTDLMYDLATPTTTQKDPYTEEQACDNWGYEYYNDAEFDAGNRAVQIPVGMVADYPINLKDKVEAYPDLPSEDGSYLLTKNGSDYTYTKFASSLPSIPTEDGTTVLKCTVSSGVATLSWAADT